MSESSLEGRAAQLREAFDRSFAAPPVVGSVELEDLLMIRVAADPYAIRLREITGIVAKRPIVHVPANAEHLLGLAGVRGEVVPVYGLASILGHADHAEAPAWMVLCGDAYPIALAFTHFAGYLRLPMSQLHVDSAPRATSTYVSQLVRTEAGVSAVISIARVAAALRNVVNQDPLKEL